MYHRSAGWDDPPEEGPCVVILDAVSKRDAINKAIRTPEFREWVRDQRFDGRPPQAELFAITMEELESKYNEFIEAELDSTQPE